ncbi:hypothetical protein B0H15DRAFT_441862 [Mycena belliarum]|uniref:Uncharacterized protein n=1 Tax=Mycena belliarum TaxID=1033014 RepID=A0AAD6TX90_9AGAR|nr:hypothetical protein B0H15DRAFT_441862 [Mycena belliae]
MSPPRVHRRAPARPPVRRVLVAISASTSKFALVTSVLSTSVPSPIPIVVVATPHPIRRRCGNIGRDPHAPGTHDARRRDSRLTGGGARVGSRQGEGGRKSHDRLLCPACSRPRPRASPPSPARTGPARSARRCRRFRRSYRCLLGLRLRPPAATNPNARFAWSRVQLYLRAQWMGAHEHGAAYQLPLLRTGKLLWSRLERPGYRRAASRRAAAVGSPSCPSRSHSIKHLGKAAP